MDLLDFGDAKPETKRSEAEKIADQIDDLLNENVLSEPRIQEIAKSAISHYETKTDFEPSESSSSVYSASMTQYQLLERQARLMQKAVARNNLIVENYLKSLTEHSDLEKCSIEKLEETVRAQIQLQHDMITQANALQAQLAALPQRVVEVYSLLQLIRTIEAKYGISE